MQLREIEDIYIESYMNNNLLHFAIWVAVNFYRIVGYVSAACFFESIPCFTRRFVVSCHLG